MVWRIQSYTAAIARAAVRRFHGHKTQRVLASNALEAVSVLLRDPLLQPCLSPNSLPIALLARVHWVSKIVEAGNHSRDNLPAFIARRELGKLQAINSCVMSAPLGSSGPARDAGPRGIDQAGADLSMGRHRGDGRGPGLAQGRDAADRG